LDFLPAIERFYRERTSGLGIMAGQRKSQGFR
jgi:hypothetical protein